MDIILNSFLLVFVGEIGDKTQLLALVLALRFKKPWTIMAGILVATLLNHALASWGGDWISRQISPQVMSWILGITFIVFAIWILFPDKEGEAGTSDRYGAFLTTTVAFFIAEMGDKTQLATVALAAKYMNITLVTIGTTLGMLASNALAIFFGEKLLSKIPMQWVRRFASILFFIFGIVILMGIFNR
ncbi:MAG: TMEM165/GDT1 family protein [Proteobacteria bacterium]|jgi:putative Ca2+/H+ antiporter (TMEM165/GDT1 family)|nr:TMEM165/GDT1 family protein [Pseudomonadota bacterium]